MDLVDFDAVDSVVDEADSVSSVESSLYADLDSRDALFHLSVTGSAREEEVSYAAVEWVLLDVTGEGAAK